MSDEKDAGALVLVTGGVRGGKSGYALGRVEAAGKPALFVATALANDDEMRARIEKHRAERPVGWRTAEATRGALVGQLDGDEEILILDCLTLYVGRRLTEGVAQDDIAREVEEAGAAMRGRFRLSVVVTNEVGWDVIPDNEQARAFSEILGRANQLVAAVATEVVLMVSGIPVRVK